MSQMFFVYVDRTEERNEVHERISRKYGCQRDVELVTSVEQIALDVEIELIAQYKTQCNIPGHWGANLTSGGEGVRNSSPEVRLKMSEAQRRRGARGEQTRHSTESRERIRQGIIIAHAEKRCGIHGRKHSAETIAKMRASAKARWRIQGHASGKNNTDR